ncbi:hypothetical protein SAMN05421847_1010 [Halpernia humi]|uniref:Entericidin n=1 Tax=Halpernia humi TaxID=493375 RepID=A0A1H5V2N7_9FLAO|nr:hypothetical protein [Halpernia humi]SEF81420.1 hypothetical protein SAMN05421847_1010 [Halpernia humi]
MKKSLFVAAIAAISLVACKKTETVDTANATDSTASAMTDSTAAPVTDSTASAVDSTAAVTPEAKGAVKDSTATKK